VAQEQWDEEQEMTLNFSEGTDFSGLKVGDWVDTYCAHNKVHTTATTPYDYYCRDTRQASDVMTSTLLQQIALGKWVGALFVIIIDTYTCVCALWRRAYSLITRLPACLFACSAGTTR
jgi:hypothetical protein